MGERKVEIRLTSTSYVVLGMLEESSRPSTPITSYKRVLAESVQDFFPVPHAQASTPSPRGWRRRATSTSGSSAVAGAGARSRSRRRGREALQAWLGEPETRYGEFRFPGILKIFFGADPADFADAQARHHGELASGVRSGACGGPAVASWS